MPILRPAPNDDSLTGPRRSNQLPRENFKNALQLCREEDVAAAAWRVIKVMAGMLYARQSSYGNTAEGRLAFSRDDSNVALADKVAGRMLEYMAFGHPKLRAVEFVGDAPALTAVRDIIEFRLNTHEPIAVIAGNGNGGSGGGGGGEAGGRGAGAGDSAGEAEEDDL